MELRHDKADRAMKMTFSVIELFMKMTKNTRKWNVCVCVGGGGGASITSKLDFALKDICHEQAPQCVTA